MPPPPNGAIAELVRAHAYANLGTLSDELREQWAERRESLARTLGIESPVPRDTVGAFVWRLTMLSMGELRSAFEEGPGWLKDRFGQEERRLLLAYAERHVDVLLAVARRSYR